MGNVVILRKDTEIFIEPDTLTGIWIFRRGEFNLSCISIFKMKKIFPFCLIHVTKEKLDRYFSGKIDGTFKFTPYLFRVHHLYYYILLVHKN